MFDTHCHLRFPDYEPLGGATKVLDRATEAGVRGAITIATTVEDGRRSADLAESDDRLWHTAGVHPLYADDPGALDELKAIAERPKCVAFGELRLDQHYAKPEQSIQIASLEGQLERISGWRKDGLAKPIVIHCRKATADLIPRLNDSGLPADQFVFHCFTGTPDEARAVLDFGAWISFTGVVTFQNAPEVARAASLVPNDRIMAETDAPFMTPAPHRNIKPNEPKFVVHVCEALAKIRGCTPQAMEELLDRNAERFFGITLPDSPRAF